MRQQTFVVYDKDGARFTAYLDMDAKDYRGRTRGVVRLYDQRHTGAAPSGSVGEGDTVDGRFFVAYWAEEFLPERPWAEWMCGELAYHLLRTYVRLVYDAHGEAIPEFITPSER